MSILFVLAGLGLIALPGLARTRLERLDPIDWCRATAASTRTGLIVLQFGLFATAAPTVLGGAGVHQAAEACAGIVGPAAPGGAITGWAAATALGWVLFTRWQVRRHVRHTARLARVESWLGTHTLHAGIDHVTIPAPRPLAYAVPGPTPQVVVSDLLRDTLTAEEMAAVVRHETSHLRNGHQRELALACEIETLFDRFPAAFRRSASVLRLAVERVADEDAISTVADRQHVRSALIKTATSFLTAVPAFTPVDTIVARIAALEGSPSALDRRIRATTFALLGTPLAATAVATVAWGLASHHVLLGLIDICFD